jgi:hypothetical protein
MVLAILVALAGLFAYMLVVDYQYRQLERRVEMLELKK